MRTLLKGFVVSVAVVGIAAQLYMPTRVFGRSMEPTFHQKDYLLVDREAFRNREPERGDVVVFQSTLRTPEGEEELLIKRVIGVSGDHVIITDGHVFINGQMLVERYLDGVRTDGEVDLEVPTGSYFCMGDNRPHSTDSRSEAVGCVSGDEIRGKVVCRIYPFDKAGRIE